MTADVASVIQIEGLRTAFGPQVIHDDLALAVQPGEVMGIVGGSGTGKSVLLRTMIGLTRPAAGRVDVLGVDVPRLRGRPLRRLQQRFGVLFQDGALFSSLTVAQNIMTPMKEHTKLSAQLRRELVDVKINLVGLPLDSANKYPSELSGGMRKRAGLAGPCRWTRRSSFSTSRPPVSTPSVPLPLIVLSGAYSRRFNSPLSWSPTTSTV